MYVNALEKVQKELKSETHAAKIFELGARQGLGEVSTSKEVLNFEFSSLLRGERPLRLLNLAAELLNGALILAHVISGLLLVHLHKVLHDALVEVFSACVVSGGMFLYFDLFEVLSTLSASKIRSLLRCGETAKFIFCSILSDLSLPVV